jgi:hypothetical protein
MKINASSGRPRRFEDLRRQVDEELSRHPDGERIREEVRRELEAELAGHADAPPDAGC